MSNIKIYVQNPKSELATYIIDGRLHLDLPTDFDLSETLTPNKLTVLGQIEDDFVVSSSIDITPRNQAIFKTYNYERIPILVIAGSNVLQYDYMIETQLNESNDKIEIQLSSNNPFRLLKDIYLCDMDFDTFNYTEQNILSHWQDDVASIEKPFYHPICFYGVWSDTSVGLIDVKMRDLRVWFRERSILEKAFCNIGWRFKSDIYETDFGKRIGNYLQGDVTKDKRILDKFGARIGFENDQSFNAATSNFISPILSKTAHIQKDFTGIYGDFTVSTQCYDAGININGYFNTTNYNITGLSGNYTLIGEFFVKAGQNMDGRLIISLQRNGINIGGVFDCFGFHQNDFTPTSFEIKIIDALPTDTYHVRFSGASTVNSSSLPYEIIISKGSFMTLRADNVYIANGLLEAMSKYINPNYNALEYIKGIIHAFNGHLSIDRESRIVTLSVPEDIKNIFKSGENIKGYFQKTQIDLRQLQVRDSEIIKTTQDNTLNLRRLEIGYRNKSDSDFTKDFGHQYTEGVNENRNPFFEHTSVTTGHNARLVSTPFFPISDLSDANSFNELQQNITPRRAIFQNGRPSGVAVGANIFKFEGVERNIMPICYLDSNNLKWGDTIKTESLSYLKWVFLVYQSYNKMQSKNLNIQSLYFIQKAEFTKLDFSKTYVMSYKGMTLLGRLMRVNDYKHTSNLTTPLDFEPIVINYDC